MCLGTAPNMRNGSAIFLLPYTSANANGVKNFMKLQYSSFYYSIYQKLQIHSSAAQKNDNLRLLACL